MSTEHGCGRCVFYAWDHPGDCFSLRGMWRLPFCFARAIWHYYTCPVPRHFH